MTSPIIIRPAEAQDAAIIHSFVTELEEMDFDRELFNQHYQHNIADKGNIYLVAMDPNEAVIGYLSCHGQILLHHGGKVFEIQEMFVRADYRGQGIGEKLVRALEDKLADHSYQSLEVTTNNKRMATREFYKKNGFIETHIKFTKPGNLP